MKIILISVIVCALSACSTTGSTPLTARKASDMIKAGTAMARAALNTAAVVSGRTDAEDARLQAVLDTVDRKAVLLLEP